MTADLLALLDQLDEARAKATPGPWKVCEDHGRDVADEAWSWVAVTTEMGREVATTWPVGHEQHDPEADAALIVAAVNALPELLRLARERHALEVAVLARADELEREAGERERRGERTPGSAPFAADRIRLFAGARHQRLAAAQLRATVTAALTPEQVPS